MSLSLAPPRKYTMIEEFKDELKDLKNILKKINKTKTIKRTINKWDKKKVKYTRWWNRQYLREVRCDLTILKLRCRFYEKPHDFREKK